MAKRRSKRNGNGAQGSYSRKAGVGRLPGGQGSRKQDCHERVFLRNAPSTALVALGQ
ncbi:hypothetical protein MPNT_10206 [Candidatus Methylacidithermus pantelleriae]|uniref:Uncharacterized protein n=1 Tax=Candidatus Methylacidithermus pantelleriae TaxID=2744239 RepID=A0A8J2BJD4_9BACT|nr:hypothetical protein MPNT_10206 [Candidatus Methylacidithermus pantelleriae]